jgi:hypothetical protein
MTNRMARPLMQLALAVVGALALAPTGAPEASSMARYLRLAHVPYETPSTTECPSADRNAQFAQRGGLCCCRTIRGDQCCNYISPCGGFVPGCNCRR